MRVLDISFFLSLILIGGCIAFYGWCGLTRKPRVFSHHSLAVLGTVTTTTLLLSSLVEPNSEGQVLYYGFFLLFFIFSPYLLPSLFLITGVTTNAFMKVFQDIASDWQINKVQDRSSKQLDYTLESGQPKVRLNANGFDGFITVGSRRLYGRKTMTALASELKSRLPEPSSFALPYWLAAFYFFMLIAGCFFVALMIFILFSG